MSFSAIAAVHAPRGHRSRISSPSRTRGLLVKLRGHTPERGEAWVAAPLDVCKFDDLPDVFSGGVGALCEVLQLLAQILVNEIYVRMAALVHVPDAAQSLDPAIPHAHVVASASVGLHSGPEELLRDSDSPEVVLDLLELLNGALPAGVK